jgi:hypothetical protein
MRAVLSSIDPEMALPTARTMNEILPDARPKSGSVSLSAAARAKYCQ